MIDAERAGKGPGVLVPPARVVVDSGAAVHLETEQIVYRDRDAGADYQRERHAWLHA